MTIPQKTIPDEVIAAAVRGESSAQQAVLEYYDAYINSFATKHEIRADGRKYVYKDQEVKAQIQCKLIESMRRFKM